MKVDFSVRALADLRDIARTSRENFGEATAVAIEARIRAAIDQIGRFPDGAPKVEQRTGVRVLSLVRYPYRIFYSVRENGILILYIRHTSRRPWPPR
jgi:toxin ParE1/3/4